MNEPDANPPPEVVEAFTAAALTALAELTQIEAIVEATPVTAPRAATWPGPGVVASVRLVRPTPGVMALVLSAEAASRLAARYLPDAVPLTDDLIDDVAGEFANVIAGQAKTMLKGTPYHFTMSPPSVARTSELASAFGGAAFGGPELPCVVALDSEVGRLLVLVHLPICPGA